MTISKTRHALNATFVHNVKDPGDYHDGAGLYLRVDKSGSRRWFQRVTIDGARHNLGLGGYPTTTLAEARQAASNHRRAISQGRDPLAEKQAAKRERHRPPTPTFADAAEVVIEMRRPTWTSLKHAYQWSQSLRTFAYPYIGDMLVSEIGTRDFMDVLTPIWTDKNPTATRIRQRMEAVFSWAVVQGYRTDNPANKDVTRVLPKISGAKQHQRALDFRAVPKAIERVQSSSADAVTKTCFLFLVLNAARSKEVRLATWSEIDLESRVWTVPAERMKRRVEHRVPLSSSTMEVLEAAKEWRQSECDLVFPSKSGKPISDMTLVNLLRRLDIPAVPHGFRSSFKDWCRHSEISWDVQETALSHRLGSDTEVAYARSDILDLRMPVMEQWASFVMGTDAKI